MKKHTAILGQVLLFSCFTVIAVLAIDNSPLVTMAEYKAPEGMPQDWRALDCWQCFEAQGRMCHHRKYESIFYFTKRANKGIGVCCKPDAKEGICAQKSRNFTCSMNSYDPNSKTHKDVLSAGNRNYQMFAYCPYINQKRCGISSAKISDFIIRANETKQTISTNEMRYQLGDQYTREYDACHYQLFKKPKYENKTTQDKLMFKLRKSEEMNVFIYEGNRRSNATKNITKNNQQAVLGKEYSVNFQSGILIVAFPNKNQNTSFEFEYWIQEPSFEEIIVPDPIVSQAELALYLFTFIFLLWLFFGYKWYMKIQKAKQQAQKDLSNHSQDEEKLKDPNQNYVTQRSEYHSRANFRSDRGIGVGFQQPYNIQNQNTAVNQYEERSQLDLRKSIEPGNLDYNQRQIDLRKPYPGNFAPNAEVGKSILQLKGEEFIMQKSLSKSNNLSQIDRSQSKIENDEIQITEQPMQLQNWVNERRMPPAQPNFYLQPDKDKLQRQSVETWDQKDERLRQSTQIFKNEHQNVDDNIAEGFDFQTRNKSLPGLFAADTFQIQEKKAADNRLDTPDNDGNISDTISEQIDKVVVKQSNNEQSQQSANKPKEIKFYVEKDKT